MSKRDARGLQGSSSKGENYGFNRSLVKVKLLTLSKKIFLILEWDAKTRDKLLEGHTLVTKDNENDKREE